jgi:cytochrome oxidase assembly protein ShyY1
MTNITTFLPQFNTFVAKGDWQPLREFENKKIIQAVQTEKHLAAIDSSGVFHHTNTEIKNKLEGKQVLKIVGRFSNIYILTSNSCITCI